MFSPPLICGIIKHDFQWLLSYFLLYDQHSCRCRQQCCSLAIRIEKSLYYQDINPWAYKTGGSLGNMLGMASSLGTLIIHFHHARIIKITHGHSRVQPCAGLYGFILSRDSSRAAFRSVL